MKRIKIYTFGFKYEDKLPQFDLTYDLRKKLANPISHLPKGAIGLDKIVIKTVLGSDTNKKVFTNIFNKITKYIKENDKDISIAFACRSGIHRSVVFAEECANKLRKAKFEVEVQHIHLKEK